MFIAYSETDTTMALQIGDEFHSIEAAEAAIVAFENEHASLNQGNFSAIVVSDCPSRCRLQTCAELTFCSTAHVN